MQTKNVVIKTFISQPDKKLQAREFLTANFTSHSIPHMISVAPSASSVLVSYPLIMSLLNSLSYSSKVNTYAPSEALATCASSHWGSEERED